jgi:hypothetical protein
MTKEELKLVIGKAADKAYDDFKNSKNSDLNKEMFICSLLLGYIYDAL